MRQRRFSTWGALGATVALLLFAPQISARVPTSVAVMDLAFQGEITPWMSTRLRQRLEQGLAATGLNMMPAEKIRQALRGSGGSCATSTCRKALGQKLKCDYLVGGTIQGGARTYQFQLWIARADTGVVEATLKEACDICGQAKVFSRMELVASQLSARMAREDKRLARLVLRSDPPGANIVVGDKAMGTTPGTLTLKPGKHQITVSAQGYISSTVEFEALPGVEEKQLVPLIPAEDPGALYRALGWSAVGAGVAAIITGVALIVLDGTATDCPDDKSPIGATSRPCSGRYETVVPGWVLTGVGVAALGGGGYLLYRTYGGNGAANEQASLRLTGAGLSGRF